MEKICKNCKQWDCLETWRGACHSPKFVNESGKLHKNGLQYYKYNGEWGVWVVTGENFGCICWENNGK